MRYALIILLLAGCGGSDSPRRKIYRTASGTVYDYPSDIDSGVVHMKAKLPIYYIIDDSVVVTSDYSTHIQIMRWYSDNEGMSRQFGDLVQLDRVYLDSLVAKDALCKQLEKQRLDLQKKLEKLSCDTL